MRMSVESYHKMNTLAAMCFDANAVIDNLSYNLDYHYYNNIAEIMHHNVAHIMPEWADLITDEMLILSARPVRKDINGYEEDYSDLNKIFETMNNTLMKIREMCVALIESADLNGDDEVRIFGEDFLQNHVSPFIKQSEEWMNIAKGISPYELNIHIKDYTHFINL